MLTDSGGFQVFSHNDAVKLDRRGRALYRNDYDGSYVLLDARGEHAKSPGSAWRRHRHAARPVPAYPATREYVERAVDLSAMWARRCLRRHTSDDQALFGIVQGGMNLDLRLESIRRLRHRGGVAAGGDFRGYGIGGYSVGEDHETMFETLGQVSEYMPNHHPRYLMGVGNPTTLVRGWAWASTCSTACCRRARPAWARRFRARAV